MKQVYSTGAGLRFDKGWSNKASVMRQHLSRESRRQRSRLSIWGRRHLCRGNKECLPGMVEEMYIHVIHRCKFSRVKL